MLNSVKAWYLIMTLKSPYLAHFPPICYSFHILCFLKGHQEESIKKKQNDGFMATSMRKRFEYISHSFEYFFLPVNLFYLAKKWGNILKAAVWLVVISDLGLFFFFKWSYHKSLSNHRLLKVCIIKRDKRNSPQH